MRARSAIHDLLALCQGLVCRPGPAVAQTNWPAGAAMPIAEQPHRTIATIHTDEDYKAKHFAAGAHIYAKADTLPELQERLVQQTACLGDLVKRAKIVLD